MSSSLFSQDSVQTEMWSTPKRKKKMGYLTISPSHTSLYIYIYIYHTLVGSLDLMGQSSKLG